MSLTFLMDSLSDAQFSLLGLFSYIAIGYGLFSMGKTCALRHNWMAWVPFCKTYQFGTLADHVCEHGEGRKTYYRHILLWLEMGITVLFGIGIGALIIALITYMSDAGMTIFSLEVYMELFPEQFAQVIVSNILSYMGVWLLAFVASIVYVVFYFIALYRIYNAFASDKATLYTVLSILVIPIPIFFILLAKKRPTYMEAATTALPYTLGKNPQDTDPDPSDGHTPESL